MWKDILKFKPREGEIVVETDEYILLDTIENADKIVPNDDPGYRNVCARANLVVRSNLHNLHIKGLEKFTREDREMVSKLSCKQLKLFVDKCAIAIVRAGKQNDKYYKDIMEQHKILGDLNTWL